MWKTVFLALCLCAARATIAQDGLNVMPFPPQQPPGPFTAAAPPAMLPYAPIPKTAAGTKAQHLRMAAFELQQAGLGEDAVRYRQMADREDPAGKESENASVMIRLSIIEVNLSKLRRSSIDFKSEDSPSAAMRLLRLAGDQQLSPASVKTAVQEPNRPMGSIESPASFTQLKADDPFFRLLEMMRKGKLASVLAEPNHMTQSGRTANFLAGGQISVPVRQADGKIGEEMREFGTKVTCLPVVLDRNTILVNVQAEVSTLDAKHAVKIEGREIPAIQRLATSATNCKLKDGETVLVGGIKKNAVADSSAAASSGSVPHVPDAKPDQANETPDEIVQLVILKAFVVENPKMPR